MELFECLQLVAIILGPAIGVALTILYTNLKSKKDLKRKEFLNLVAYRKSIPVSQVFVDSLNKIDVIFKNDAQIIAEWKKAQAELKKKPFNITDFDNRMLDLLKVMGESLGYNMDRQTDLSDFYTPENHYSALQLQVTLNQEFLRVLENSESFSTPKKK
ncbi:hypothetical protein O3Q51_16185 [Cryomorphaceae bacterium 1068]|nr:hypothetical protein [Cryomorphaceae bacterium 1068]